MSFIKETLVPVFERAASFFSLQDFIILWVRVSTARIFYDSGRTKAQSIWGDGYLTINDFQAVLFEEEYGLTFLDPALFAQLALYAETFFPLMLFLGLGARFASCMLIGMTLFIQIFVYPGHFMEHATWLVMLVAVFLWGPGKVSCDYWVSKNLFSFKKQ